MSAPNQLRPPLVREPAAAFLRRPGAALSLAKVVLPEDLEIDLAGVGTVALRFACRGHQATAALLADAKTTFEALPVPSMGPGVLLVERPLARHLVSSLLGLPTPPIASPLSRIERGVLAGLVADALVKLGLPAGVGVGPADAGEVAPEAIALEAAAHLDGHAGHVWLCAPQSGFERCWERAPLASEIAAAVVRLELARTDLPTAHAMAAAEGDVVVFDQTVAVSLAAPWPLQLCCNGRRTHATLDPDGRLHSDDRTVAASRAAFGWPAPKTGGDSVDVTAEIGCATADGAADLNPAETARGDGILMRLGEEDWAEGALCEVDGRLAVRITRMLAR